MPVSRSGGVQDPLPQQVKLRAPIHDSVGEWQGLRCCEGRREWSPQRVSLAWRCEPIHCTHHVACSGNTELLQVCFRKTSVPRPPQAAHPDALRERALDARPLPVLRTKGQCGLALPCCLQGAMLRLCPELEGACALLLLRAIAEHRADLAGFPTPADFNHIMAGVIVVRPP